MPQPKTILIIEDDRFLSRMYADMFGLSGYRVVTAFEGASGLAAAERDVPDGILLDLMLPIVDGFQVLERLRSTPFLRAVPVVILTNLDEPEQIERARGLGAVDVLVKAHNVPAEVVRRLTVVLEEAGV